MPICKKCGEYFPSKIKINEKFVSTGHRKFCLKCNPFGNKHLRIKNMNESNISREDSNKLSRVDICNICNKEKVLHGRNLSCSACRAKQQRHKKKQKILSSMDIKCKICGYEKSFYAIDFHHLNPEEKEFEISEMWHLSIEAIKKELSKCIPLCRNCHAELHAGLIQLNTKF